MMTLSVSHTREHEWRAYYARFPYFSPEAVRDGCYPRIMEHEPSPGKAIVLVHGLCDSPYFMTAIGDYFFHHLRYNVYLPLLHGHGLKAPNGMEDVDLDHMKGSEYRITVRSLEQAGRLQRIDKGRTTTEMIRFRVLKNPPLQASEQQPLPLY